MATLQARGSAVENRTPNRMCNVVLTIALVVTAILSAVGIYTLLTPTVQASVSEWVAFSFVPLAALLMTSYFLCSRPWALAVIAIQVLIAAGTLLVALLNHGLPEIAGPWTWGHVAAVAIFIVGDVIWILQSKAS